MNDFDLIKQVLGKFFNNLNNRQLEAVLTIRGPVLILAGAGSGKTTAIINRIANMVLFGDAVSADASHNFSEDDRAFLQGYSGEKDPETMSHLRDLIAFAPVKPWNILAVTFTNKAAGEMRERLERMLGEDGLSVHASTFHSACIRILRAENIAAGLPRSFSVYDADDSLRAIKTCISDLEIDEKVVSAKAAQNAISRAKDKLLGVTEYQAYIQNRASKFDTYYYESISKIYFRYTEKLRTAGAVDFDDIIMVTVKLLQENPEVLRKYQNRYKYITVDEYQDTNIAQFKLIELLSGETENICVVGDDDQSIYKFRGATIENILGFEAHFKGAKVIKLEQNYRSTSLILGAANSVISCNKARKNKTLWTALGDGEPPEIVKFRDSRGESDFIAQTVKDGVKSGKNYNDFAVLYRANSQSAAVERALSANKIPYRIIGGLRFFDRKEIKDVLAYMSLVVNPFDIVHFSRIINEPKRGIGDTTVSAIEDIAFGLGISPIEVCKEADTYVSLLKKAPQLKAFHKMYEELVSLNEELPLDEFYTKLLEVTGYKDSLKNCKESKREENEARLENIEELLSEIKHFLEQEEGSENALAAFLEGVTLFTDTDKYVSGDETVNLLTIHSAKGLEWDTVFVVGVEEGIFPSQRSMESTESIEEERRLAYVAITRARRRLFLTHASERMYFGRTNRNPLSRFAKEIDEDYVKKTDNTVKTTIISDEQKKALFPESQRENPILNAKRSNSDLSLLTSNLYIGARVLHPVFGEGMIISKTDVAKDCMLEISFDTVGTKKVMAKYAKITKI
ncbi:MAG: UvrD-helicase domain-containing protein [Ruminococcus sp.]|jgi:DNA helicase-2/ATP-dependent DNA helicase PcrA|nr:UvrD-helicase domain-containing protein [Ruminococcus sp.]